jgi:hypothetical protein
MIVFGGPGVPGPGSGTVTFHFPDGTMQQLSFQGPGWLGPFHVNPRFHEKLCGYASRAERGQPVQILQENPWMK